MEADAQLSSPNLKVGHPESRRYLAASAGDDI